MRSAGSPLVLLLTLALAPGASASWSAYTGVPVGIACYGIVTAGDCPELSSSAAQFGPFDATRIDLAIHDQAVRIVGATYTFYDTGGSALGPASAFCQRESKIPVPPGAHYLIVNVDSAITKQHCGLESSGVSGYITLRLR